MSAGKRAWRLRWGTGRNTAMYYVSRESAIRGLITYRSLGRGHLMTLERKTDDGWVVFLPPVRRVPA